MSADLNTRVSFTEFLNRVLIRIWSIWFLVVPSGDVHVVLCIFLRGTSVPVITNSFMSLISQSLSPLSFRLPKPCLPITLSFFSLYLPFSFHLSFLFSFHLSPTSFCLSLPCISFLLLFSIPASLLLSL